MNTMIFPEFLEAVARVALLKWEDANMGFNVKLEIALDTIMNLTASLPEPTRVKLPPPGKKDATLVARELNAKNVSLSKHHGRRSSFTLPGKAVVEVMGEFDGVVPHRPGPK